MSKERDQSAQRNPFYRHGMTKTTIYVTWQNMKRRCLDPKFPGYDGWGGRGITVCERWLDFTNFYKDMGEKPKGLTLERIDNDGNYEPSNCRWATPHEQLMNQRLRKDNSSGYRGIQKHSDGGWMLRINNKYHGHYKTVDAALEARKQYV